MVPTLTSTIIDKSQVWRIAIGDSLLECKQTWLDQGVPVNHFEAITPDTMDNFLKFSRKQVRMYTRKRSDFTKVEKAIFYSHFMLWRKCYKSGKPMVIIEHDTELTREFNWEWDVETLKYFCITHTAMATRGRVDTKYTPAAGYVLTPHGAQVLINNIKPSIIDFNVDHYIRKYRDHDSPSWAVAYAEQKERDVNKASHNK
jgi:GR25 family glycosyltransferase involved in LPS biosynthesis